MMQITEHKNKSNRRRRWPWISILVVVLSVVLARLSLRTGFVHEWVRSRIIQTAGTVIDGRLEIGSVDGDLLREIIIRDLRLIREDTVLRVDTLRARYRAVSYFQPEFQIDEVRIVRPHAHISRSQEGEWNVPDLIESEAGGGDTGNPFLFNISSITLSEGEITGTIRGMGLDSVMAVRELNIEGGFGYYGDSFSMNVRELGFNLEQTRLNEPVSVQSSIQATDRNITLERFIIATGASVLESTAAFSMEDSSAAIGITASPLSLGDIAAYAGGLPVEKNLQMDMSLSGNLNAFNLVLEAEADGLEGVRMEGGFRWGEQLVLESLDFRAEELRLNTFFENNSYPSIAGLRSTGSGSLAFSDMEQTSWAGQFTAYNLNMEPYGVSYVRGSYDIDTGEVTGDIHGEREGEWIDMSFQASPIWSDAPEFMVRVDGGNIDPSYWTQNPELDGSVNFKAELKGEGYRPGDQDWSYTLELNDSRVFGQEITGASMSGILNSRQATIRSTLRNRQGRMVLDAEVENYMAAAARYNYDIEVEGLNLSAYVDSEDFNTSINGTFRGEGEYMSLDSLQLTSSVRIDSSTINREHIEEILAEIQVSNGIVYLNEARIRSAVADGRFDARIDLNDRYDVANRLSLNMQIKDLGPIAPLIGVERLEAAGEVNGVVTPRSGDQQLEFAGSVNLSDLVYNDVLTSRGVNGDVYIQLQQNPAYTLDLMLEEPVIKSIVLQDINTSVRGRASEDSTWGDYQLMFRSASGSEIRLAGSYSIADSLSSIQTTDFRIISDLRTLALRQPFTITLTDDSFQMDTVRIDSDDGALMELAIPYADSLRQRGYLQGENLNMTVIQNTLLNQAYFEGILSGRINLDRNGTEITSTGDLNIREIVYKGLALDSLVVVYNLAEERLEGRFNLFDGDDRLAEGELNVPFKLGDPETFDQTFFDQNVAGYLRINEVPVNRFSGLLEPLGISNTDGLLRLDVTLGGLAGEPSIETALQLRNATISGVAVDSLVASFSYVHTDRELVMNATVVSLRQRAAEVEAAIPVFVDMRNFVVELPEEGDRVRMEITTNRFNLASLNDFVSRTQFREIGGTLNGDVTVTGTLGDLATNGEMNFRNGAIRIVEAGIRVDNIRSDFVFDDDVVRLTQFSARSGNGTFRADGSLELTQLRPGEVDVNMNATNFRLANTSEYSAIINMNTHLGGEFVRPHLSGSMEFVGGFIYLQNFGERSVEDIELNIEGDSGYDYYVQYDSLSLDMDVSFNRRFFVRNRRFLDLEYELEGQVDLVKQSGQSVELFGSLSAVEGYARPLGKRFQLEEGVITFEGDPANPLLRIRHLFEPPQEDVGDVRIWYVIEGSVEDPSFMYESDPLMGLEDIISYTLFGRPFSSLSSWRQVVANSGSSTGPASVAMDVLLDRVEALATQHLGIDVVQIDNTGRGGSSGTSIKTGWYLNPKTFFAIQNDITGSGPDTIFTLEYLLKRNLKLIITQGSDSQTGVDLRWKLDY